jgi:DNA-binding NarL/FixJ family response regulator
MAAAQPRPELVGQLTPREQDVLRLVVLGQTNREIADTLALTVSTVKTHVEHVIGKLGVSDRTQAAVRAIELGLAPPPHGG